jgi:hypothetical protein
MVACALFACLVSPETTGFELESAWIVWFASNGDWVVSEFGGIGAGDLELISTIVYADREGERDGKI